MIDVDLDRETGADGALDENKPAAAISRDFGVILSG